MAWKALRLTFSWPQPNSCSANKEGTIHLFPGIASLVQPSLLLRPSFKLGLITSHSGSWFLHWSLKTKVWPFSSLLYRTYWKKSPLGYFWISQKTGPAIKDTIAKSNQQNVMTGSTTAHLIANKALKKTIQCYSNKNIYINEIKLLNVVTESHEKWMKSNQN